MVSSKDDTNPTMGLTFTLVENMDLDHNCHFTQEIIVA